MFDLTAIDKHFPKESYREGQRESIEFVLNSFNNGKNIVILEAPVGSGKSVTGITIADMVNKSYYLTITKILQDQLINEFGSTIVELKGRNAYPCTFWERNSNRLLSSKIISENKLDKILASKPDCNDGYCRRRKSYKCDGCFTENSQYYSEGKLRNLPPGYEYSACPYYEQVYRAINARKVSMNFHSFLYQVQMTNRFNDQRDLMIIDEAHNIESLLLDFISFSFNDFHLQKHGILIPEFDNPYEYAMWFIDSKIAEVFSLIVQQAAETDDTKLEDEYKRLYRKFKMFMEHVNEDGSNWVCQHQTVKHGLSTVGYRTVTLKPIYVNAYAHPLIFKYAKKILLMSGTILDVNVMCKSLGLNRDEVATYRMKNRFPAKNRPIYIKPVAKMIGGNDRMKSEWGSKLVDGINKLVNQYQNVRGIIHTHNFAIASLLMEACKPEVKERFLFQRDFQDKATMLQEHSRRSDSIIVAPAMHEGLDLAGDLSRLQIICKVPYPNFFDDPQLSRRIENDRRYLLWTTAIKIIQSYGRSVRSETDWADTYILDESINRFLSEARSMIPSWFTEAISHEKA